MLSLINRTRTFFTRWHYAAPEQNYPGLAAEQFNPSQLAKLSRAGINPPSRESAQRRASERFAGYQQTAFERRSEQILENLFTGIETAQKKTEGSIETLITRTVDWDKVLHNDLIALIKITREGFIELKNSISKIHTGGGLLGDIGKGLEDLLLWRLVRRLFGRGKTALGEAESGVGAGLRRGSKVGTVAEDVGDLAKGGILTKVLRGGGKILGKVGKIGPLSALLSGGLSGLKDYQKSGSLGHAGLTAAGTGLGTWGGMAAGAELGMLAGSFGGPLSFLTVPAGALIGGAIGAYEGGKGGEYLGKGLGNLIFGESKPSGTTNDDIIEAQIKKINKKDPVSFRTYGQCLDEIDRSVQSNPNATEQQKSSFKKMTDNYRQTHSNILNKAVADTATKRAADDLIKGPGVAEGSLGIALGLGGVPSSSTTAKSFMPPTTGAQAGKTPPPTTPPTKPTPATPTTPKSFPEAIQNILGKLSDVANEYMGGPLAEALGVPKGMFDIKLGDVLTGYGGGTPTYNVGMRGRYTDETGGTSAKKPYLSGMPQPPYQGAGNVSGMPSTETTMGPSLVPKGALAAGADRKSYIFNYFKNMGYSDTQAAAATGTFQGEAGPGLNPSVWGGYKGHAFGLGQWLGTRRDKLFAYARSQGVDLNDPKVSASEKIKAELDFATKEEANPKSPYYDAGAAKAFANLHSAKTADEGVDAMAQFERWRGWRQGKMGAEAGSHYTFAEQIAQEAQTGKYATPETATATATAPETQLAMGGNIFGPRTPAIPQIEASALPTTTADVASQVAQPAAPSLPSTPDQTATRVAMGTKSDRNDHRGLPSLDDIPIHDEWAMLLINSNIMM